MPLELRVPPLAVVLVWALGMWLVARVTPALAVGIPWRVAAAIACAVSGAAIALAGVVAFRQAHTTVNPTTPEASSAVVTSGVYRWSRNPMYLGFLVVLAGWAVYLANVVSVLLLPAFVAYMTRFQIKPEERALEAKFGAPYTRYEQQVRRWL
jgi:protein-S-isoprenylcysteine O-methyltransferase Ste14